MTGEIEWAGVDLSFLEEIIYVDDVIVEEPPETGRPARKIDRYKVPGRNGDIILTQDAWENVERSYDIIVHGRSYSEATAALADWLYGPRGYRRLWDSFDPEVYRLACVSEDTRIRNLVNTNGRCTIEFDCDPRRFLLIGESSITLTETDTVTNPTAFIALPMITVYGSGNGTISCGGKTIAITEITDGMVLDSERQDAYLGTVNLNSTVSGAFPVIPSGEQTIMITGGITSVTMAPNWWTL